MKSLTKNQLVTLVAEQADISKTQAKAAIESMVKLSYQYASADNGFTIPGLGKFQIKTQRERQMRNPRTQEPITVPAKRKLRFSIAREAKNAVAARDEELGIEV